MGKLHLFISKVIVALLIGAASTSGQAQKFQQASFKECWHLESATARFSEIASDNQIVFIPLPNGLIEAADLKTGAVLWQSEIGGEIVSGLKIGHSSLFVLSRDDKNNENDNRNSGQSQKTFLSSLSLTTGVTQWRKNLETDASDVYLLVNDTTLYIVLNNGMIYLLNEGEGFILPKNNLKSEITISPVIAAGNIFIADKTGKIYSLSLSDPSFTLQVAAKLQSTPTLIFSDGQNLFAGDQIGQIYKLNKQEKKPEWSARVGAAITNITEQRENLLVSSSDNFVYLMSKKKGSRIWKKRLPGKNLGAPPISENTAVFSPLGEPTAIFSNLKNGQTVNQLTVGSADNFFTGGADIYGDFIVFPTLQGIFAYSANGCR